MGGTRQTVEPSAWAAPARRLADDTSRAEPPDGPGPQVWDERHSDGDGRPLSRVMWGRSRADSAVRGVGAGERHPRAHFHRPQCVMTSRGWPSDWVQRKAGKECPFCASIGGGDNEHTVAVAHLPYSEVRLERRSRLAGYCIVVWTSGHVAEPTELDHDQASGYWQDVLAAARALQRVFDPMKINLLTLGNWVPHLHTHVVPRYLDDPAPGGPIAWDAMFSDLPTAPDVLADQAAAIRAALPRR